jgi:hypothetical protein
VDILTLRGIQTAHASSDAAEPYRPSINDSDN